MKTHDWPKAHRKENGMSSKYSKQVIEAACEAIDWAEGLVTTDALVLVVFDTLERAPWWEEAEVGYEFTHGEPHRVEAPSGVSIERATTHNFTISAAHQASYFRDTRWTPPPPPLAVGDLIETIEDLERLPVGAGVVDYREEIALKRYDQRWNYANLSSESCGSESVMGLAPITVIYLPKVGDDE